MAGCAAGHGRPWAPPVGALLLLLFACTAPLCVHSHDTGAALPARAHCRRSEEGEQEGKRAEAATVSSAILTVRVRPGVRSAPVGAVLMVLRRHCVTATWCAAALGYVPCVCVSVQV